MDGAGLMRLSIADASLGSSTGSVDAFWERLQLRFTFGFKAEAPAAPRFALARLPAVGCLIGRERALP